MSAHKENPGFTHLVQSPEKNFSEYCNFHFVDGKADDIHRRERLSTHGVDVGQRICHAYLTKGVGIIDNGCEEVEGLYDGEIISQFIDPGVIGIFNTNNQIWIRYQRKPAKRLIQVTRTYFAGSPRTMCCFCESNLDFIIHVVALSAPAWERITVQFSLLPNLKHWVTTK